jgi:hypothetical protein
VICTSCYPRQQFAPELGRDDGEMNRLLQLTAIASGVMLITASSGGMSVTTSSKNPSSRIASIEGEMTEIFGWDGGGGGNMEELVEVVEASVVAFLEGGRRRGSR